jgi:hypothetical protein
MSSSLNHSASTVAVSSATSLSYMVDRVKMVCLHDLHGIAAHPYVNT